MNTAVNLQSQKLHIASVLTTNIKHGVGDLAEGGGFDCFHQRFEHVFVVGGRVLQIVQGGFCFLGVTRIKCFHLRDLELFFGFSGADDFAGDDGGGAFVGEEGVDTDDRQLA